MLYIQNFQQISGFDESSEYIAIWNRVTWDSTDWLWEKYYGDGSGTNFTVSKYDVIKIYLTDSSTQTIYIAVDYSDDYTGDVNQTLLSNSSVGKGYNFNGVVKVGLTTTLNTLNSTTDLTWDWNLGWAEAVGVWNDTDESNPKWDWWFAGFPYNFNNSNIYVWNILQWKIATVVKYFDTSDY